MTQFNWLNNLNAFSITIAQRVNSGTLLTKSLILFLTLIFLLPVKNHALSKEEKKAENFFKTYNYTQAIVFYKKLAQKSPSKYLYSIRIAESYKHLNNQKQAEAWYKKAIDHPEANTATLMALVEELKKQDKITEAMHYIKDYQHLAGDHPLLIPGRLKKMIYKLKNGSQDYAINLLQINSEASEFGPFIYGNQLIFSSNRPIIGMTQRTDLRNNQPFYKLWQSTTDNTNKPTPPQIFNSKMNSSFHDGPLAVSPDSMLLFITRNAPGRNSNKMELDIGVYRKTDGKWQNNKDRLPLKRRNFDLAHPCFSPSGNRLYFASNMPGGQGGMDIYYCVRKGLYLSPPVNLGPSVNTPGNEVFPFINKDGWLYFTSDGHFGLGGYDLFLAIPIDANNFSKAHNLGTPINSPQDDFSLVFDTTATGGYFASNRPGGMGADDIYRFKIKEQIPFIKLEGIAMDKDSIPLNDVTVVISDSISGMNHQLITNKQGEYTLWLENYTSLEIKFNKDNYLPQTKQVPKEEMVNKKTVQIDQLLFEDEAKRRRLEIPILN